MSRCLLILALTALLAACATHQGGTIADLRNRQIEIREVPISGGLEKAMEGYRRFLEQTPASALSPEATRRLADLKLEKEYGFVANSGATDRPQKTLQAPVKASPSPTAAAQKRPTATTADSELDLEQRATADKSLPATAPQKDLPLPGGADLENADAAAAVALYRKLLDKYPLFERNDQVLYQLSRAYEELGRIEEAMETMNRLVREYPASSYIDEVQFRRGEYFFMHRRYLDAEDAYKSVALIGVSSAYYQLALYKLGWTFYKQELYEASLHRFIALLDYKVSTGYDFDQTGDEIERKRMDDAFRVISLAFSALGGADAVADYFASNGQRSFEDDIYSNLAEYYYGKRRYSDAVGTYTAFVSRYPFHRKSPLFQMRVIEIHVAGGFPSLVIDAKKAFASAYGLKGDYWLYEEPGSRPEVLTFLKTNLTDLANHYHALYRDPRHAPEKATNFSEALHWYRECLTSFPLDAETPAIHYQLADLLLENKDFAQAAVEYEKTAYDYPRHEQAATAGYAAVYAYRQHLATVTVTNQLPVKRETVRSSLKFAETFPDHAKAAIVLGAAADDLYDMEDFQQAQTVAKQLIATFPDAETTVRRDAWLIAAHSAFKLEQYAEAETNYLQVLALLPDPDTARAALVDNLAASIYKQGEQARAEKDDRAAASHFLRVGIMAPTSKFRPTADYDAAAALIRLEDWMQASTVLLAFRASFPDHELQPEVTKKIAYVYRQSGQLALAAAEFERVEQESQDDEVRREALLIAAQLYSETGDDSRALEVYQRYVKAFPQPVELNLETRDKIAKSLRTRNEREAWLAELRQMVAIDATAGDARTPRTRFLAGNAALALAEVGYQSFAEVKLVKPFKTNLAKKQKLMKTSTQEFTRLLDYEVGEVTAAATFYLAEIYANLSRALMASERPDNLGALELEQYELALEDQAYPFEEKAITVHQNNLELIPLGIYNSWIERSLQKLAQFIPARYDRPEATSDLMTSLNSYRYERQRGEPANDADTAATTGSTDGTATGAEAVTSEAVTSEAAASEPAPAQGEKP